MINQKENKVVVAFIGAFSSGKSSLVNSLLGESLFSTDITPETALPIELYSGQQPSFTACWLDGNQEVMSAQQFADAEFSELANQGGWVVAHLPHLKCWPNLVLVDLPGWSSGQSTHERQIDEYLLRLAKTHLDKNIFFVLAISADEGALRDNVRERLQDLNMGNSPYFLVLTKSEKRAEVDIQEICSHLCETVTSCIGKLPEKLIITSARKKQVEELRLAIDKIQQTEENKKSSVDFKVLAKNIDEHIKRLQKNADYINDVAIDVSENVLDDFEWGILESHFDGLPYK